MHLNGLGAAQMPILKRKRAEILMTGDSTRAQEFPIHHSLRTSTSAGVCLIFAIVSFNLQFFRTDKEL